MKLFWLDDNLIKRCSKNLMLISTTFTTTTTAAASSHETSKF